MALEALNPETRNAIDGELTGASNGATFENVDPATEEVLGSCADGTKEDMEAALAAARRAFDETGWAEDHGASIARCLRQLYEGMLEEKEQLRSIVVREAGAPVSLTAHMFVDDSDRDDVLHGRRRPSSYSVRARALGRPEFLGRMQMRRIERREPVGVAGCSSRPGTSRST